MKRSSPGLALKMSVSCREGNSKFRIRAEKFVDCEEAQRAIDPERKGFGQQNVALCLIFFLFYGVLYGYVTILD